MWTQHRQTFVNPLSTGKAMPYLFTDAAICVNDPRTSEDMEWIVDSIKSGSVKSVYSQSTISPRVAVLMGLCSPDLGNDLIKNTVDPSPRVPFMIRRDSPYPSSHLQRGLAAPLLAPHFPFVSAGAPAGSRYGQSLKQWATSFGRRQLLQLLLMQRAVSFPTASRLYLAKLMSDLSEQCSSSRFLP